jgi:hypothetical protein
MGSEFDFSVITNVALTGSGLGYMIPAISAECVIIKNNSK